MSTNIGLKIKELRESNHLTMEEFGNRIGVGKSAVNKYEKGKVENLKRTTIEQICKAFNVTPEWLLGLDDNEAYIPDEVARMMNMLNKEGQEKVLDYIADLVASGRYSLKCGQDRVG